jgi:hypothetical protein
MYRVTVRAPEQFRIAYCAVVEVTPELEVLPVVCTRLTSESAVSDNVPAMAMSTYSVMPLLTICPHEPEKLPSVGSARFRFGDAMISPQRKSKKSQQNLVTL